MNMNFKNHKVLYFSNTKDWLLFLLNQEHATNTKYSIRQLAKDLGISKTILGDFLNDKRKLSLTTLEKISKGLNFTPKENNHFLKINNFEIKNESEYLEIADKDFSLISEWYFIAILCLAQMPNIPANSKYIANRFNIKIDEAEKAISLLEHFKLLSSKSGYLERTSKPIAFSSKIPSSHLRKYHRQNLKLAEFALDNFHLNERIFSSISVPSNKSKLKRLESAITKFKEEVSDIMGTEKPEQIYTIAIQVFPISK